MRAIQILSLMYLILITGLSCTDPLPPRIDPYQTLRGNWFFQPKKLKSDTLITSIDPSLLVSPISISPYLINEWDEAIEDTSYIEVHITLTLLNNPDATRKLSLLDTTVVPKRLLRGDSLWVTFQWNHVMNGQRIYKYLRPPSPNFVKNRLEYEVARVRLEGTIRLFKNLLPKALPPKEILIFYWNKMT